MRRAISADIRLDPATGRQSGVYIGSSKGPARISGTRRGNALVMTITYPKPVYGDRTARMTISSTGTNGFTLTVVDKVDGAEKTTSSLTFKRS